MLDDARLGALREFMQTPAIHMGAMLEFAGAEKCTGCHMADFVFIHSPNQVPCLLHSSPIIWCELKPFIGQKPDSKIIFDLLPKISEVL